jgi:NADH-dependent peroxiredoxin subunit F
MQDLNSDVNSQWLGPIYDLIIIGAGPAGIAAGIYAARKKLKTLMLSKNTGGQAAMPYGIEGYAGYQLITGTELMDRLDIHLKVDSKESTLELKDGIYVNSIEKLDKSFNVSTDDGAFSAKAVIIATGRMPLKLNVPGEKEFSNKGVTYCATCDAPVFDGKDVAVVGGGNSALDAAIQLMAIASRIWLVNISNGLSGDPVMIEKVIGSEKVTLLNNSEITEIKGDSFVKSMDVQTKGQPVKNIPVDGIFIEIGAGPALVPVRNAELKLNAKKEILVNERCETSVEGLYAAGDISNVPEKQVIVAAGQGSIAALSVFRYLSRTKF